MKFSLPKLAFLALLPVLACQAQEPRWEIIGANGPSRVTGASNTYTFDNGVILSNQTSTVSADHAVENVLTGAVRAEGDVIIIDNGHVWRGTNIYYDFNTGQVLAGAFKTVQMPFNLAGQDLRGSNHVYSTTNGIITTDDVAKPFYKIRARTITIVPGQFFEAYEATVYLGSVPVFYWPHYKRYIRKHPINFEFVEGYRSTFGPFLFSTLNWYGEGPVDGSIHFDMREKRGLAGGPDLALHGGEWGDAAFRYYYAYDQRPNQDGLSPPHIGQNQQLVEFFYQVTPTSNFTAKATVHYQNDPLTVRDFFEHQYRTNVEPASVGEATQLWPNWTLDAMAQPQVTPFFETVERLPDVKLSALPQQIGVTPLYYDGESSMGYYRRAFASTNVPRTTDYEAFRADTFHQLSLPETFFGWLNVTPRMGGRITEYGDVEGPTTRTNDQSRGVFNTGVDVSFKASRIYPDVESSFLDLHELRHIVEPEVDYVYVPAPTRSSSQLPQFDYQLPSLRLLPIEFPQYNSIDSINQMNVVRLALRNKLQTKRKDGAEDFINWAVYTDLNLNAAGTNKTLSELYSDLQIRPRTWLTFNSSLRYDLPDTRWREAILGMTLQPASSWSISLGYYYLMNNDPEFQAFPGQQLAGQNLISGSVYYRLNENWAVHVMERFQAQNGTMQEQRYSLYRDLRSWTAAVTVRVASGPGQPTDFGVFVTMSLKAFPRFGLGSDRDAPSALMGGTSTIFDPTLQ